MAVLGYLPKLKRSFGLAFGTHFHFGTTFPCKCSLFNVLSMEKVSLSYLFSFSLYQTKCVMYTVDDVKNFKNYLESTSRAIFAKRKEIEYLERKKAF